MELITFRCSSCNQGLKVPADKAGRRVKCTKCGTALTIPPASQANTPGAKPAPGPAPVKRPWEGEDEDDDGGVYGVEGYTTPGEAPPQEEELPTRRRRTAEDEDEDEEEYDEEEVAERDEELRRRLLRLDREDEEEDEDRPRRRRKRPRGQARAPLDPDKWQKIRVGLVIMVVALCVWAAAILIHEIYVIIGLTAGSQYAKALFDVHPHYADNPSNQDVNLFRLIIVLVGGTGGFSINLILERISQVVFLLSGVVMAIACAFCMVVPPRFGTRGLVLTTLIITGVNLVLDVVFRLLPAMGAMPFVLMPLLGPEVPMLDANRDRMLPLQLGWTSVPYVQVILTVFIVLATYAPLVTFPLFLRAAVLSLRTPALDHKIDPLTESALGLTKLAMSQVFIQLSFPLLTMTGTSDVLSYVVRVVYCAALAFFSYQLIWYIMLLFQVRAFIQEALDKDREENG